MAMAEEKTEKMAKDERLKGREEKGAKLDAILGVH